MTQHDLSGISTQGVSRRAFIGRSLAALAAALFATVDVRALLAAGGGDSPAEAGWNKATFAKHVNQKFTASSSAAGDHTLNLVSIKDLTAKIYHGPKNIAAARAGDCFLLVFSGPADRTLRTGTYRFQHAELGQFSLFITLGKSTADGQRYEAVVNHALA